MKPVYQMHTWFARRVGSEFRALILASFLNEEATEEEFWHRFYSPTDLGGPIILDPFMGGGTTIVEALRLGCRVIGVDLNPVAWFVVKKEVEPVDLGTLERAFKHLEASTASGIKRWYLTSCPSCGQPADIVYAYWVKEIPCERCGALTPLFQHYAIAKIKHASWLYCPHCDEVFKVTQDEKDVLRNPKCPSCHEQLRPFSTGRRYTCRHCGHEGKVLDAVRKAGERPQARLFALQYYCPHCGKQGCKSPEEEDRLLYQAASHELGELKQQGLTFPDQEIPYGEETRRILNYGYRYFHELFNDRQLLCLAKLAQAIARIEDRNVREYFLLAFSNTLEFNNTMVPYIYNANKVESCFSLHNYLHAQVYAENNVWGTDCGRGTFIKCYEQVKQGKLYCLNPFERVLKKSDGKQLTMKKVFTHDRIEAWLVDSFDQLRHGKGNALLRCQSSTDLSFLSDKSVDAVITDPPYFDNVVYSGVADLFYSWLKGILSKDYECFRKLQSPREEEIVVNPKVEVKSEKAYLEGLSQVFRECRRVLKDDGLLAFTFHHTKARAWFTVLKAVLDSGFSITAAWPIHSESRASPHAKGLRSVLYDVILVCRKRRADGDRISWEQVEERIREKAQTAITQLCRLGLKEIDLSTVIVGKSLEVYSKHYPNVFKDGRPLSIEEAIQAIEEVVEKLKIEAPIAQMREPSLFD
jgi:adenine-specific DNA methylase